MINLSRGLRASLLAGATILSILAFAAPISAEGTLVVARPADIFTFDPYNTQDDRSIFTELSIYDRLVKLSADGKGVEPELATSWTVASDGLTADFVLRDGVKFWDGTPPPGGRIAASARHFFLK